MCLSFRAILITSVFTFTSQIALAQIETDPEIAELVRQSVQNRLDKANRELRRQRLEGELLLLIEAAFDDGQLTESIELLDYQRAELSQLQEKFDAQKKELEGKNELSDAARKIEYWKLKRELTEKVAGLLVEHQLAALTDMSINASGLPRSLTESFAGKAFELTDAEKESIRKRATALSKEVEQQFQETRRKAYDTLFEGISLERREKIRRFYGEQFDRYFSTLSLERLVLDFNYDHKRQRFLRGAVKKTPLVDIIPSLKRSNPK